MSVKLPPTVPEQPDDYPNWLQIEWTPEERLHAAGEIMAFSSQSWGTYHGGLEKGAPKTETWALYCLILSDSRDEARDLWRDYVAEKLDDDSQ